MEKNFIPNFKKSGDGLSEDMLKLKKLEAISDGWYKGQLIKYLEKVAGKIVIDGVECYNTDIPINSYTSPYDNSEKAKNIKKLLELFGLSDNAMNEIYETSVNPQVEAILLNFNKNNNLEREYTEFDFRQAYIGLKNLIDNASSFTLTHSNKYYLTSEIDRPAMESSNIYTGTAWVIDNDYFDELQEYEIINDEEVPIEIIRDFSIGQAMHFSELNIYNELNEDITIKYPSQILRALKCLLVISGKNFLDLKSIEKISEEIYYNSGIEKNVYVVVSKEKYSNTFSEDFLDTQFERYKKGNIKVLNEGTEQYTVNGILANNFWTFYIVMDSLDNDKSNDLFYISKKKYKFKGRAYYGEGSAKRYITVSGLKKTSAKITSSYISQYADFQIVQKKKKKKFLGIGGFVGNFLGGIFELVLQAVGFISKILFYVPVYKIQIQFIGWIFSGEWSNDRDRFVQISTRVILVIVAAVITFLTAGAGWELAVSLLSSAYGLYTGIQEYDKLVEMAKQKQIDNNSVAENELLDKALDLSNNEDIVKTKNEIMYKPFTEINNTYKNTFDKGGMYDIKYGL